MASSGIESDISLITTERLLIRPTTLDDTEAIYQLRSNPQVVYWQTPATRSEALEWLETKLADPLSIVHSVSLREHPEDVVGSIGGTLPFVGYSYQPYVWNKGYATEALKALIDIYWKHWPDGHPLLEESKRGSLMARTGQDDLKSPKVLKKCGFSQIGTYEVEEEGKTVILDQWELKKPLSSIGQFNA